MPEYVVTILSTYIVTAPDERDAGEAAYDVVTGCHTGNPGGILPRKRGEDVHFSDGRILKAFNAELAVPVEEVVEKPDAEEPSDSGNLLGEADQVEIWTVRQESDELDQHQRQVDVWWVRDHDEMPIVSDKSLTEAIELAEAIGNSLERRFKIVQEKS